MISMFEIAEFVNISSSPIPLTFERYMEKLEVISREWKNIT